MNKVPVLFLVLILIVKTQTQGEPQLHQITHPVDHAEGPTWDNRTGLLYFVDIHSGLVYSYHYSSGEIHSIFLQGDVTPVVPSKSDPTLLIVGLNRTVVAVQWDGKREIGKTRRLVSVSERFPRSRFNDGKADSEGRLWFGTMGFEYPNRQIDPNRGVLYKITRDRVEVAVAPVNISNGLAWNKGNDRVYYIDTPTRQIVEYSFDSLEGEISNKRTVFDLAQFGDAAPGFPDGMTIDQDDNLWVALFGGGSVIKVNPSNGIILQTVAIPADRVTSCMWGGPNLDILFVTTSRFGLNATQGAQQPMAGSVFAILGLGTKGRLVFEADIVDYI